MSNNFVFIDNLYRSRITLLDILEERGYNTEIFRNKFSPVEATAAAAAYADDKDNLAGLNFQVSHRTKKDQVCEVRYATISRQGLDTFFNDIPDEKSEMTEVIVMMPVPLADAHHVSALKQYVKMKTGDGEKQRRKLRVAFFNIEMLVNNPLRHSLVPKHEIVPEDQHAQLMASMFITAKSKFPEIKFHVDPIVRCYGAVPGDIIRITRPSASSGEAIIYRVCTP